ncbi:MAG TPA: hypothetical protein VIL35_09860 [Vicinamibacterales bacterium]
MRANLRTFACIGLLASMVAAGCVERETSVSATNFENTEGYQVIAEEPDGRALRMRVRLQDLDDANTVANKLIEQKKSLAYERITIEFIGREDPEDGPPRRTRSWSREGGSGAS